MFQFFARYWIYDTSTIKRLIVGVDIRTYLDIVKPFYMFQL